MANTKVTTNILTGSTERVVMFTLTSDGSQETGTVIYDADASGFSPTTSLNTRIMSLQYSMCTTAGRANLIYNASTNISAWSLAPSHSDTHDFSEYGGLQNGTVGASGVTGDILLTTTGLASGDSLSLIMRIKAT